MKKIVGCIVMAGSFAAAGLAAADGDSGVPVYPGARSDAETTAVCAEPDPALFQEREAGAGIKKTKQCFRTSDALAKVAAFFKGQKGFAGGVVTDEKEMRSASFCKGTCNERSAGTSVSVSAPWFAPGTFKVNNDLLIVIIDRKM